MDLFKGTLGNQQANHETLRLQTQNTHGVEVDFGLFESYLWL